ncbi:MAG: lecithin retinol acyltransferase family protein [Solirubrobacteraceae bacterium]
MARGDHIYVDRGLYEHHGIDIGDGTVIDFSADDGTKSSATIRQATLEDFVGEGVVQTRTYGARLDPEQAVARARSQLGASGYDLFANNCEHFATWCVAGEHSSSQVEAVASTAGVVGVGVVVPQVGVGIVATVGETTAMSGPNLMSGLAAVGGSVVGGIVLLGGLSGLLASGTMCLALRDKPMLPDEERQARRIGRYGAIGGAALGVGVSLHAVGAMGVAGYGGAGLTSGLAALGGVLGGGMAQGILATLLLPAVFAVGIGYLLYRAAQWLQLPPQSRPALPGGGV